MDHKPQLNVFAPFTGEENVEKIAEVCNSEGLDWRHLLDMGISRLLKTFLDENSLEDQARYARCLNLADEAEKYLNDKVGNDRLRFRGIAYILKSMCETMFKVGYRVPCDLQPALRVSFFAPFTSAASVDAVVECCLANKITALELIDVGLSLYGVEEVMADYSIPLEIALLDIDRIGSGAMVGKMLNGYLKYLDASVLDRVVVALMMTKAGVVNLLGVCGKLCHGDCGDVCHNEGEKERQRRNNG